MATQYPTPSVTATVMRSPPVVFHADPLILAMQPFYEDCGAGDDSRDALTLVVRAGSQGADCTPTFEDLHSAAWLTYVS